ncbi:thiamine ABC transporter substrate-binding protein [Kamptonema cortianum]|nr:thiamine ABC transporter substrate-binding protein [Kamptonema cortianum]
MQYRSIVVMLILMAALSSGVMAQNETVLRVVTHDSFAYSEEVMQRFTEQTGIVVEVVRAGDAGTLVNQAVLTRSNPLGDVLFGVDNTFLSRALAGDIFIPYESPALSRVHEEFVPDADVNFAVTPIDFGDVCLNYDVQYFEEAGLDVPDDLADLSDPSYRSLLTVQNPATSSPGLAFLITTIAVFGEEGDYTYLDFWRDLVANDVLITDGWTDAYFGHFSGAGGSDGTRPLVVSYASSPPVEVLFAEAPVEAAPTASIVSPDTCFRQIEYAGILAGTQQEEAARQFIDFLLSREFQEDMPLNMFVFPVVEDAELPDLFVEYAQIPDEPVEMSAQAIDENRERWIETWIQNILR